MHRTKTVRLAAIALLLPTAIALGGCKGKTPTTSSSGSSSSAAASGNCAAGYVAGQIGGQPKCLQNGQQCQDANASDYKKYGFVCAKNNGRYELKKS